MGIYSQNTINSCNHTFKKFSLFKASALWADAFKRENFLEIRNPWGKVMEKNGLTFENFVWKWSKIAADFAVITALSR